ncbi:MAG: hypothetical protein IH934_04015 [Nanoarchaeota archaeon]|nr:hypothetical protein [Nanoarchaeota archaeon]
MTTTRTQRQRRDTRLGIHPMFEGLVMPREVTEPNQGVEEKVRQSLIWDTAEAAFAYFNRWSYTDKQRRFTDTIRYIRETQNDPDRLSLPILEEWSGKLADKSIDETTEELWRLLEKGVRQRHEGMDKFLTMHAIEDAKYEPRLTRGGIWRANVVRRGDERRASSREVRLWNADTLNGRLDIARIGFREPSPIYMENFAKERRHGDSPGNVFIAGYHVFALLYHINELDRQKKVDMGLHPNYFVFSPFDFLGNEYLVTEAVGRRYLPIPTRRRRERNIYAVSNFLIDHPEIFSHLKPEIDRNNIFVGVGKLYFEDAPHRDVLDLIDYFLTEEEGYKFNGFAVDFRQFGPEFQTDTTVYTKPDMSRSFHIIYDGRFNVPPLFLFKITRRDFDREKQEGRKRWEIQESPQSNPFELFGQWYHGFDRHTQRQMVNLIIRPDKYVLDRHKNLIPEYDRFQQTRLNI